MHNIDVSVIIVNWNTRQLLRECIESVYEHAGEVSCEIIVIDNASSDGSPAMVRDLFPEVRLIKNPDNCGFARANNQGMQQASGRYVLLLNSDARLLGGALGHVVEFADNNPDAAVVGCRVLNPDMTLQPTCFMFPSVLNMILSSSYLYKVFANSPFFGRERMTWWQRNDVRPVDVVTGCFMLVRSSAIESVGLLDERFFMYAEETDWCYRFRQAGWRVLFTPDAEIVHYGGQSSRSVRPEMLLQLRLSILKFIRKHHGRFQYAIASAFVFLFIALRLPVWFLLQNVPNEQKSAAEARVRAYTGCIRKMLFASEARDRVPGRFTEPATQSARDSAV